MRTLQVLERPSRRLAVLVLAASLGGGSAISACGADGPTSTFDAGTSGDETSSGFVPPPLGETDASDKGDAQLGEDAACATASVAAVRVPAYLQLVVDASGSMDGFDGISYLAGEREPDPEVATTRLDLMNVATNQTGRKWIALRGALKAFFDDLVIKADPFFAVGMYLFSSTAPKLATAVDVPISYVNAAHAVLLKDRLSPPIFPMGGTPLLASIDGQLPLLAGYAPVAPVRPGGKRVLVVITDGVPTVSAGQTQAMANAAVVAIVAAARAATPSTPTFAIGVGNPLGPEVLFDELLMGRIATAGGTGEAGCNTTWSGTNMTGVPCHLQVTPGAKTAAQLKQDFLDAFNRIRDKSASCELTLDRTDAGTLDPTKVNVFLTTGGTERPVAKGTMNGWSFDNDTSPTKVVLNGSACTALKGDPNASARIVIGCTTVVEPPPK
jgi:hypothetical protein